MWGVWLVSSKFVIYLCIWSWFWGSLVYSLRIVHNADSNSAQIEWQVDVPIPSCKLKLENKSPFARPLMPMAIHFSIGTGDLSLHCPSDRKKTGQPCRLLQSLCEKIELNFCFVKPLEIDSLQQLITLSFLQPSLIIKLITIWTWFDFLNLKEESSVISCWFLTDD